MKQLAYLILVFAGFTGWLYFLYWLSGPDERLHFPTQLEDLKELSVLALDYRFNRPFYTLLLFVSVYIYKQSFAIPGSFLLGSETELRLKKSYGLSSAKNFVHKTMADLCSNGALYGVASFPGIALLSAIGASNCYFLSKNFGKEALVKYFPERINYFQKLVEDNRNGSLFMFLLSLRLFPMTPNWLINMASPIVGVPILPFFISVFFGLMPYNYITVQAGEILTSLQSVSDVMSYKSMFLLCVVSITNIAPILYKKYKAKTN